MAIKKGSAAAKAWGRKMKRLRAAKEKAPKRKSSVTKLKRNRTMVKRRAKTKRRTSKAGMKIFGINMGKASAAMIYGALRARTSAILAPYTSKLPLGNVADEAGMIAAAWAGKKYLFKKAGVLRDALNAGQTIELARVGEAAASGNLGIPFLNGGAASPSGNGTNIF